MLGAEAIACKSFPLVLQRHSSNHYVSPSPLPEPTPSSNIQPIDARPNLRVASHLPPIFTEQRAREHELCEVHHRSESESLANYTKAKQGVYRALI